MTTVSAPTSTETPDRSPRIVTDVPSRVDRWFNRVTLGAGLTVLVLLTLVGIFLFLRSREAKERLRPALSPGNLEKTMAAPVTAIVAYDLNFHEHLPRVFPHKPETKDGYVVLGSESGVLPVDPANVERHGRLEPGKMFLVDLDQGRLIEDDEIKEIVCKQKPYGKWVKENKISLDDVEAPPAVSRTRRGMR